MSATRKNELDGPEAWLEQLERMGTPITPETIRSAQVTTVETAIAQGWTGDVGQVLDMLGIGAPS